MVLFSGMLASGCIPMVVGNNTFRPAGEIRDGSGGFAVSAELAPLMGLAGASEPDTNEGDIVVWPAADISFQHGFSDRLELGGQLKWASIFPVLIPLPVGLGANARYNFLRQEEDGISMDGLLNLHGLSTEMAVSSGSNESTYKNLAFGGMLGAAFSHRAASFFAITGAPFLRAYYLGGTTIGSDGAQQTTRYLVYGMGASVSLELKGGPFVFAPAMGVELVGSTSRPGLVLVPTPGLSVGGRW
jgi:hypothetical protein